MDYQYILSQLKKGVTYNIITNSEFVIQAMDFEMWMDQTPPAVRSNLEFASDRSLFTRKSDVELVAV